jgi:LmbE family N-acetylglucosaminyl deacetylase
MDERFFEHRRLVVAAPHPDDDAFACGAWLAKAAKRGIPITICTFFTRTCFVYGRLDGDTLEPTAIRHAEQEAYVRLLGPDCRLVYADHLDALVRLGTLDAVFDTTFADPERPQLVAAVTETIAAALAGPEPAALLLPLALGDHADHRIVREGALAAADRVSGTAVYLYEDLPYSRDYGDDAIRARVGALGRRAEPRDLTYAGFEAAKKRGMACYHSQDSDGHVSAETLECGRRLNPDQGAERYWRVV